MRNGITVVGFNQRHLEAFFRDLLQLLKPLFDGVVSQQPCYVADTGDRTT